MLSASFTAMCPVAERRDKRGDFFIKPSDPNDSLKELHLERLKDWKD